jgi:hypothetical protein
MVTFVTEHRGGVMSGKESWDVPRGGSAIGTAFERDCVLRTYSTSNVAIVNAAARGRFLTALYL